MAPRLRKDLVATTADDQGVACVEVADPINGTSFRFYDFEYALAQELTGQPLENVVAWAQGAYGIELSAEALEQFLEKLSALGFLEGAASGAQPSALSPSSPSSGSQPFGDLPTTVAIDPSPFASAPAPAVAPLVAAPPASSSSDVDAAAAPEGLISGDATEYSLRGAGSGLWERPEGLDSPAATQEPFALLPNLEVLAGPLPPVTEKEATPSAAPPPAEPASSPLQATGENPPASFPIASDMPKRGAPLPALSIPVRWPPPDLSQMGGDVAAPFSAPRAPTRAESMPSRRDGGSVDTPLASIAQAIAASIAPTSGAAEEANRGDSGEVATPLSPPLSGELPPVQQSHATTSPPSSPSPSPSSWPSPASASSSPPSLAAFLSPASPGSSARSVVASSEGSSRRATEAPPAGSWAAGLAEEVDRAPDDRRQPPPPDVVVMPPMAEPRGTPPPRRRRSYAFPLLLVLVAGGSGAVWFLRLQGETEETPAAAASSSDTAPRVHVVSPQPTTFHRWFDIPGVVTPGQDDTLSFRAGGRIQEVLPPGTTFVAGEIIGRLYGAPERELTVNRLRSRVAFYEQLRDTSRAEGAEVAAQTAEAKLAARRQELAAAQAALAEMQIRPRVPGTIAQLLVAKTAIVKPGTPIFLVRSAGPRAIFPLSVEDAARARALGFCRVETVPGTGGGGGGSGGLEAGTRAIDCAVAAVAAGGAPESRLAVDLVGATGVISGTQVRLASARYDGVFPVPRSALVREGNVDHVWVVSGGGRFAERRTVETVGTVDELALVAHGIAVGDAVIVDPPATLKGGAEISVAP